MRTANIFVRYLPHLISSDRSMCSAPMNLRLIHFVLSGARPKPQDQPQTHLLILLVNKRIQKRGTNSPFSISSSPKLVCKSLATIALWNSLSLPQRRRTKAVSQETEITRAPERLREHFFGMSRMQGVLNLKLCERPKFYCFDSTCSTRKQTMRGDNSFPHS